MSSLELTELLPVDFHQPSSHRHNAPAVPLSDVEELVETVVVLKKDPQTSALGISVVGGSDTYLGCVVIEKVSEGGPAWIDGRLKRGDILLQVNDTPLVQVPSDEAVRALKESSSPVRLLVLREDPEKLFTTKQEPTKFLTVELRKASMTERLGLSLMERSDGYGIFVTLVEPGGLAARYGRILQGDKLLEVNGIPVAHCSLAQVANQLRSMDGSIVLLLGRIPSLVQTIQAWARTESRTHVPARLRIHTWSHSRSHRHDHNPISTGDPEGRATGGGGSGTGGGGVIVKRIRAHSHHHPSKTRSNSTSTSPSSTSFSSSSARLIRTPSISLLHVLRRSLRGRTSIPTQAIVRTCTPDSEQSLLSNNTPGSSPQIHVRFRSSEVISMEDVESSCGSSLKSFI